MKTRFNNNLLKPCFLFIAAWACLLWGCTAGQDSSVKASPRNQNPEWRTYLDLKRALDRDSDLVDYDTLMEIHRTVHQAAGPIPHLDQIIAGLISKKNPNPRVDNIILIVAAVAIGDSPYPIDQAGRLFETILSQDHRLNSWVLAYVGDALGKYPVDLPRGDQLADILEKKVDYHVRQSDPEAEFFGFHFLPPPRGDYLRNYLARIDDQRTRVFERNCYYMLVGNGLSEVQIEAVLRKIQASGTTEGGEAANRPLKYMVRHWDRFWGQVTPVRVPRPDGL